MKELHPDYIDRCVRLYELALAYKDIYDPKDEYCRFHDLFEDLEAGTTPEQIRRSAEIDKRIQARLDQMAERNGVK